MADRFNVLDRGALKQTAYKSGWYLSHAGPTTTTVPTEAQINYMPLVIPASVTADRVVAEITGAGTAGAVVRLGIYAADTDGIPGDLILDAGTIDGTSATIQTITISQALSPGLVFLCGVVQGGAGTRPTMRARNGAGYFLAAHNDTNAVSFSIPGYLQTSGAAGALPASAAITGGTATIMSLGIRLA